MRNSKNRSGNTHNLKTETHDNPKNNSRKSGKHDGRKHAHQKNNRNKSEKTLEENTNFRTKTPEKTPDVIPILEKNKLLGCKE